MPRQPRSNLPDGLYHVTAQAVSGLSLFVDDEDRRAFLWLLGSAIVNFGIVCQAYCLMGTHYHLLVQAEQRDLSLSMKQVNGRYARRFNERHGRHGHLFAERYSAYLIRDERHFEEACSYIAENPVLAGLCQHAGDWPWAWVAGAQPNDSFARVAAIRTT